MKYRNVGFSICCFICLVGLPTQAEIYTDSSRVIKLLSLAQKAKDPQKAISYTLQALSIGSRLKSHELIARSYRQMGYLYRKERKPQLYKLDSLCLHHARLAANETLFFDALQLITKDYLNINQVVNAEKYLPLLDSLAEKTDMVLRKCVNAQVKAFYYIKKFKPGESLAQAKIALHHAALLQDNRLMGRSLSQVADGYLYQFKHDSAIICLFKAIKELEKIKDEEELARVYGQLGLLFQTTGNLTRAAAYYEMSLASFEKAGNAIEAAYVPLIMSDIYFTQHKNDTAFISINRALSVFRKFTYLQGMGLCYSYLGRYYAKTNQKDSADHYTTLSKEILQQYNNHLLTFYAEGYETVNAIEGRNFSKGDSLLKRVISRANTIAPPAFLDKAAEMVAFQGYGLSEKKALQQILQNGDSSQFANDTILINPFTGTLPDLDSLYAQRLHAKILEVEARYKVKETEQEILLVQQQLFQRTTVLIFSLLLLAALGILLHTQIKNRKRALEEKQRAITEKQRAVEDKATIGHLKKELSHRVRNTLENISFHIDLVRTRSVDKRSFDLLKEKVMPIMVLYRMLDENNTENINLQNYFEIICKGLKASYDHDNKTTLHIEAPVIIDGNKAGRLGFILYELVTNSFKYAFHNQSAGNIKVVCSRHDDKYYLSITDSGPGIQPMPHSGTQEGLQLVRALAHQLRATIRQKQPPGAGFEFYF